jgi:endoglucanase
MIKKNFLSALFLSLIITISTSNAQGYLHASGKFIYGANNQEVLLKGIGTGNWMINEGYMMKSADFAGTHTEFRTKVTETIGEANTEIFYQHWLDNQFTRRDVDSMKAWGFNSVRVAMHYKWLTLPIESEPITGQDTWLEEGFVRLDSLLAWCRDNQMYLILDMHGAPGGQGHDTNISDYDPSKPSLWESAENRRKLVALWKKLAQRYANEPWIGGYDVINEPNWDLPNGTLLRQTYVDITDAIRQVDTNHMIIIEGNWFANDYTGLTPPWDDNMVFSFHKYWNYNNQSAIQWMVDIRNAQNVPIWLGETGENSNSWFTDVIKLCEGNKIGWSMWPVKKAGINNVEMVQDSPAYEDLLSYWKTGAPSMTATQAYYALLDWADQQNIENCTIQRDVIDAMIRQPHSSATLPLKQHIVGNVINMTDYDLGKCSSAYWDADTANYNLSTNIEVDWNEGWAYRNDGVDIEKCSDTDPAGNGFDVGWTGAGEWLQYTVTSDSAAAWQVVIRNASGSDPAIVHLSIGGTDVCQPLQLPTSGGWQIWQSTTAENIIIPAGTSKIRFCFDKGVSDVSYFKFVNPVPVASVPFNFISGTTNTDGTNIFLTLNKEITDFNSSTADFQLKFNGAEQEISSLSVYSVNHKQILIKPAIAVSYGQDITITYTGNNVGSNGQVLETFTDMPVENSLPVRFVVPIRIQAEDFNVNNGFQPETCTDINGGTDMGYANNGDYLDYSIYVPQAGSYTFSIRVASAYTNGSISVRLGDGSTFNPLASISVGNTGGWQNWTTKSYPITLPQGSYTLRLYSLSGEYNINWIEIAANTGMNEIPNLMRFDIYPNPSQGCFFVEAEFDRRTSVDLSLYDLRGREMLNFDIGKTDTVNQRVIHRDLEPGVYVLCLSTEQGILSRKVVLN